MPENTNDMTPAQLRAQESAVEAFKSAVAATRSGFITTIQRCWESGQAIVAYQATLPDGHAEKSGNGFATAHGVSQSTVSRHCRVFGSMKAAPSDEPSANSRFGRYLRSTDSPSLTGWLTWTPPSSASAEVDDAEPTVVDTAALAKAAARKAFKGFVELSADDQTAYKMALVAEIMGW